jgi:hypothetical protein
MSCVPRMQLWTARSSRFKTCEILNIDPNPTTTNVGRRALTTLTILKAWICSSRLGPTEIAHTIVSWEFDDGQHLAISIETRKAKGESYSALRGFFRQYELYYVVADERDLVGLRTNYRSEQVCLYRIRIPIQQARALLIDYLTEVNRLADHPQWYNALTQNCTTAIRGHAQSIGVGGRFDWRLLANGHVDQLLYERNQIDTDIPFGVLRNRSNITEKAKAAGDASDFSARIREGLPEAS